MHPSPTAVSPAVPDSPAALAELLAGVIAETGRFVLGKEPQIRLALCSLLAEGHLLIEDIPGIGKTTLAKALAGVLGLDFRRIQCTSDMLPGDILGVSVFEQKSASFSFHPGPIFTRILLADEINRTTPKTQSALLEAMEERRYRWRARPGRCPHRFSSSPPRTRWSRPAPIPCPNPSSTVSCSA